MELLKSARDKTQPLEIGTCIGHGSSDTGPTPGILFCGPKRPAAPAEPRWPQWDRDEGWTSKAQSILRFFVGVGFNTIFKLFQKNVCTNIWQQHTTTLAKRGARRVLSCSRSAWKLPLKSCAKLASKPGSQTAEPGEAVWFLLGFLFKQIPTWQFCWWPFWDGEKVTLSKVVGDLQRLGIRRSLWITCQNKN